LLGGQVSASASSIFPVHNRQASKACVSSRMAVCEAYCVGSARVVWTESRGADEFVVKENSSDCFFLALKTELSREGKLKLKAKGFGRTMVVFVCTYVGMSFKFTEVGKDDS
jgi:hypothetical protein